MKLLFRTIFLVVLLSLALPSGVVQAAAPPYIPQVFYGEVTIGGIPALDDATVSAEIDDVEYASTTTSDGQYVLEVPGEDPAEPGKQGGEPGDTVVFKVNTMVADSQPFDPGMPTELDLAIEGTPPVAGFSAIPLSGDEPLTVQFTDESQNMIHNPSWLWDFSYDSEAELNVESTEQNPTHEYLQEGSYTVFLVVTTDYGADGETETIVVADTEPVASFTADPTSGDYPLGVSFTDTSTSYDGITSWEWDFTYDDLTFNVESTEQNPVHSYEIEGTYTVALVVREADGDWNAFNAWDLITVAEPNISVSPMSKNFGEVTIGSSSSPQTVTVSNVGTAALTITDITISGPGSEEFSMSPYPDTIPAGDSAGVNVTFSPTSTGAKSATLAITSNDPDEATVEVSLSGTGVTAVSDDDGDGGGGGSAPTPTYYTETNLFGTEDSFSISSSGKVLETIEATSADGNLTITIRKYTIALDKDGDRLASLETAVDESPPDPPEDANIIGLAYEFGPDGATFDPAITFTWSYDPDALPEGVAEEDLVLAYHDEATGEWVELDGVVDTVNNTITASVAHFTTFAIIGAVTDEEEVVPPDEEEVVPPDEEEVVPPDEEEVVPPDEPEEVPLEAAAFSVASLSVTPLEVEPGETVTISVLVANTGDLTGSYEVTLKINNTVVDTKEVTLDGGASQTVTFTTFKNIDGVYTVSVDGLSGSFTVVPVVVPPTPGFNWALLVGIIAAVIVVGVVSFFLIRRRRFA